MITNCFLCYLLILTQFSVKLRVSDLSLARVLTNFYQFPFALFLRSFDILAVSHHLSDEHLGVDCSLNIGMTNRFWTCAISHPALINSVAWLCLIRCGDALIPVFLASLLTVIGSTIFQRLANLSIPAIDKHIVTINIFWIFFNQVIRVKFHQIFRDVNYSPNSCFSSTIIYVVISGNAWISLTPCE